MAFLELFTILYKNFGNKNKMVVKNHLTIIEIWFTITIEQKTTIIENRKEELIWIREELKF